MGVKSVKINRGVEWAAHACALLAALPTGWSLNADVLASYHEVPAAYMAKQMQALARAGLVASARGGGGGYRLTKPVDDISLLDIYLAIEGSASAFRCMEIRQNGPCGARKADCKTPCGIASRFYAAEQAFRDTLSRIALTEITAEAAGGKSTEDIQALMKWLEANAFQPKS